MDRILFGKRFREFCNVAAASQVEFAAKLDMSPQMLQKYLQGERLPMPEVLNKLRLLGCNINWLLNGDEEMLLETKPARGKTKQVPLLAEVECGVPVFTQINQDDVKYTELPDVNHLNNPFLAVAKGDSMRPYINPGDLLLCVDDAAKIKDGRAVVVNFKSAPESYMSNAKLIKFLEDDRIMLYSVNTKFPPSIHRKSDIYRIYKVVRIIREVR